MLNRAAADQHSVKADMTTGSHERLREVGRRVVSVEVTTILGLFVAGNVAGFSGLFRNFWSGPDGRMPEVDRFDFVLGGLMGFVRGSVAQGWPFGLLMMPIFVLPWLSRVWALRLIAWTLGGALYGYFSFGGYGAAGRHGRPYHAPVRFLLWLAC